MNERIRELAEQANIRFGRMAILDGDPRGTARFVTYSTFEKFFELVVQECAEFVEQDQGSGEVLSNRLKQYFGIEESRVWICPKCGVDRRKESCPIGYNSLLNGQCPMVGVA